MIKPPRPAKKNILASLAAERFISMMVLIFFELQACFMVLNGGIPAQGKHGSVLYASGAMAWVVAALFVFCAVLALLIFLRSFFISKIAYRFLLLSVLLAPVVCAGFRPEAM